jgi:hypothetical protein
MTLSLLEVDAVLLLSLLKSFGTRCRVLPPRLKSSGIGGLYLHDLKSSGIM